jgi:hypothetical protein
MAQGHISLSLSDHTLDSPVHIGQLLFSVRCATRALPYCPLLGFLRRFLGLLSIFSLGLLQIF